MVLVFQQHISLSFMCIFEYPFFVVDEGRSLVCPFIVVFDVDGDRHELTRFYIAKERRSYLWRVRVVNFFDNLVIVSNWLTSYFPSEKLSSSWFDEPRLAPLLSVILIFGFFGFSIWMGNTAAGSHSAELLFIKSLSCFYDHWGKFVTDYWFSFVIIVIRRIRSRPTVGLL